MEERYAAGPEGRNGFCLDIGILGRRGTNGESRIPTGSHAHAFAYRHSAPEDKAETKEKGPG